MSSYEQMDLDAKVSHLNEDSNKPFTKAENINELNDLEFKINTLNKHSGTAIANLGLPHTSLSPAAAKLGISLPAPAPRSEASPPPDQGSGAAAAVPADAMQASFKAAVDDFLTALHAVDVHLKRSIWRLEEAGIINPKSGAEGGGGAGAGAATDPKLARLPASQGGIGGGGVVGAGGRDVGPRASLDPDDAGRIGKLDVGFLNSRSDRVERGMELELAARARAHFEKLANEGSAEGAGGDAMVG